MTAGDEEQARIDRLRVIWAQAWLDEMRRRPQDAAISLEILDEILRGEYR